MGHLAAPPMACAVRCNQAPAPVLSAGFAGYTSYAPTKWALRGLADCLRNEVSRAVQGLETPAMLLPSMCLARPWHIDPTTAHCTPEYPGSSVCLLAI